MDTASFTGSPTEAPVKVVNCKTLFSVIGSDTSLGAHFLPVEI